MKKLLAILLLLCLPTLVLAQDPRAIILPTDITPYDCSIAITTGGTAQNLIDANSSLTGFIFANIDTTEVLWVSFTGDAAPSAIGSFPLAAVTASTFAGLSSFSSPVGFGSNKRVSVYAATTGHKISCSKW